MVYTKQDFFRDALTENLEWLTPEEIVSQIPQERIKILAELSSRRALAWRFINQREKAAQTKIQRRAMQAKRSPTNRQSSKQRTSSTRSTAPPSRSREP